jgi:hypothetical protein
MSRYKNFLILLMNVNIVSYGFLCNFLDTVATDTPDFLAISFMLAIERTDYINFR